MLERKWAKGGLVLVILYLLLSFTLEMEAYARAGGGRSFGSRGSRSYSTPYRPAPSQTQASPTFAQPQRQMSQPFQQPGGFMRGLAGGIAGGILGGLLFRSLGFAGNGFGGGGIGLMDIILIGGILYAIYWFIKRKRLQESMAVSYRGTAVNEPMQPGAYSSSSASAAYAQEMPDKDRGIDHIRQMDYSFDEKLFQDACMDYFFKIQGAWMNRDLSGVQSLLTDEMYRSFREDIDRLKMDRRINRLENIAVRSVDITEAWQENGMDFITVKFYANLLDYTTDESGAVVSGSKTDPVKFEEYWTFTRPVGVNSWRLSAITQAH